MPSTPAHRPPTSADPAAGTADVVAVTRRFLQLRRRGPADHAEVAGLVTPDVTYTEVAGDLSQQVVGADAVAALLRARWGSAAASTRTAVIRHVVVDGQTAVGHWRTEGPGGTTVGRDTYTIRGGRVAEVVVEAAAVDVPTPVLVR